MKLNLKKSILSLLLTFCILGSTTNAFTQDNINSEDNEKIEAIVTVDSNLWKDKEGYYSENRELIMVIPINTIVYIQDTPRETNYALCKYKDASGNETFGYISKDNIKFYYLK